MKRKLILIICFSSLLMAMTCPRRNFGFDVKNETGEKIKLDMVYFSNGNAFSFYDEKFKAQELKRIMPFAKRMIKRHFLNVMECDSLFLVSKKKKIQYKTSSFRELINDYNSRVIVLNDSTFLPLSDKMYHLIYRK